MTSGMEKTVLCKGHEVVVFNNTTYSSRYLTDSMICVRRPDYNYGRFRDNCHTYLLNSIDFPERLSNITEPSEDIYNDLI